MSAQNAIQTIQAVLTTIDDDLSSIFTCLQDEFARLYPLRDATSPSSSHLNPFTLLTKLRNLQTQFPTLREELLQLHQQKADLAQLCRSDLAALHRAAVEFLPVAAPTLDHTSATPARSQLHQQLAGTLHESERKLSELVGQFLLAHSKFVTSFPGVAPAVKEGDLDLELLRIAAVKEQGGAKILKEVNNNNGNDQGAMREIKIENAVKTEESKLEKRVKSDAGKGKKVNKAQGVGRETKPPPKSEGDEDFVPVEKAVYNRLPRNLKIKAGKFAEINAFYEQVWGVLREYGKPMAESMLMRKVGEGDTSRLEVLRGLAVVRAGKDGWMLAAKVEKGGRKVRR